MTAADFRRRVLAVTARPIGEDLESIERLAAGKAGAA